MADDGSDAVAGDGSDAVADDGDSAGEATGDRDVADRETVGRDAGGPDVEQSHDAEQMGVDWRSWLLVAVVVLSFVVVPVVVILRPPRLPFEAAFLALPMVPAVLLGATAVWVAVRGRAGS